MVRTFRFESKHFRVLFPDRSKIPKTIMASHLVQVLDCPAVTDGAVSRN
jgi:hypothetical protein